MAYDITRESWYTATGARTAGGKIIAVPGAAKMVVKPGDSLSVAIERQQAAAQRKVPLSTALATAMGAVLPGGAIGTAVKAAAGVALAAGVAKAILPGDSPAEAITEVAGNGGAGIIAPAGAVGAAASLLPGIVAAAGIPAALLAAFGLSELAGVQYPWETPTGEGFMAPWTEQWKDPVTGMNIRTPTTYPMGFQPSKMWATHAQSKEDQLQTTLFVKAVDGRVLASRNGVVLKVWRPVKNIVMARGKTTLSQAVKAQRYLDKMWRTVARKTKQLKLA